MKPLDHLAVLSREATLVQDLVRIAAPADLSLPVAGCPGWDVHDLVTHLGGVHRWAARATRTPPEGRVPASEPPSRLGPAALADWSAEGAAGLLEALAGDPDQPCWTLAEPRTVGFWRRRQAQETTVHRWDLQTAFGQPASLDPDVALDGVHEVLTVMLPRQVARGRTPATPGHVRLVADGHELVLATQQPSHGPPLASLTGTAAEVLLVLWGRLDPATLHVDGDREALTALLDGAPTP